jgi:hypothetical protein
MEEVKKSEHTESRFSRTLHNIKRATLWFFIGLFLGALLLAAFRFVNLKSHHTHYHANFALYLNGQRDEFKSPTYYEEVQACGADPSNPRNRVHLHDMDPYTVHVHDDGATWGALFANLGYTLGNSLVRTSSVSYIDGLGGSLKFVLNGEPVVDVANRTIRDGDVLLISYGDEDQAELQKRYDAIPRTAEHHDHTSDPATCSGSQPLTLKDRFKAALGLN